ncbi:MAG: hypothetical protein F4057_03720 [Acidobacteria bacterium]|nr:hypothetical protein [Acidobacteriota bacterium]
MREPVHGFRTLLTDLGTLATNTMQVADSEATFTLQTQPTLLQQRCSELLGVQTTATIIVTYTRSALKLPASGVSRKLLDG